MTTITSNTHAISINPVSGEQIGSYAFESDAVLNSTLSRARQALQAGSVRLSSNARS